MNKEKSNRKEEGSIPRSQINYSILEHCNGEGNRQPAPVCLPGESQGRVAWWPAVYGIAQSPTRLKQLNSSSSRAL